MKINKIITVIVFILAFVGAVTVTMFSHEIQHVFQFTSQDVQIKEICVLGAHDTSLMIDKIHLSYGGWVTGGEGSKWGMTSETLPYITNYVLGGILVFIVIYYFATAKRKEEK